ncbi:MAG TPA: DUF2789 domain-containing protein [Gammaproteobacteria bacterium]
MEPPVHSLTSLFNQLGLDSSEQGIDKFINNNKPLPGSLELHNAKFWNSSQASFLKQVKEEDADWVEIVDQFDAMLRK